MIKYRHVTSKPLNTPIIGLEANVTKFDKQLLKIKFQ
jgi:hypothetical protein